MLHMFVSQPDEVMTLGSVESLLTAVLAGLIVKLITSGSGGHGHGSFGHH
ncbi:hypothetical protein [Nocardia sp. IFM 10818]